MEPNKKIKNQKEFNVQSVSNESTWNLVKTDLQKGWDGQIINRNMVMVDQPNNPKVLEKTENVQILDSRISGGKEGISLHSKPLEFDLQKQKNFGIKKIHVENSTKKQVIEEEVEQKGEMSQISKKNTEASLISHSIVNGNLLTMDLQKNSVEHSLKPKHGLQEKEIQMETITEERLRVVKESDSNKEENRIIIETSKMFGNQSTTEVIQQEHVRILNKTEVKKTIIQLPKTKGKEKIAKIEITNKRTIYKDNISVNNDKDVNYEVNMISKVNLETTDLGVIKQESLMKDLFRQVQDNNNTYNNFSYEEFQNGMDNFQVKKEVLREEIKKEKGEKVTIQRKKQVVVLDKSDDEKLESTLKENKKFFNENKTILKDIPKQVYQSALNSMSLPTQTLKFMADKFNGKL